MSKWVHWRCLSQSSCSPWRPTSKRAPSFMWSTRVTLSGSRKQLPRPPSRPTRTPLSPALRATRAIGRRLGTRGGRATPGRRAGRRAAWLSGRSPPDRTGRPTGLSAFTRRWWTLPRPGRRTMCWWTCCTSRISSTTAVGCWACHRLPRGSFYPPSATPTSACFVEKVGGCSACPSYSGTWRPSTNPPRPTDGTSWASSST
mmetsp:Transcript_22223/g.50052  ORF Transcript_22223/g.50052 Transcript_22223/m.50052 type:complete len:201 (+) Transcript_22223:71-673(+)